MTDPQKITDKILINKNDVLFVKVPFHWMAVIGTDISSLSFQRFPMTKTSCRTSRLLSKKKGETKGHVYFIPNEKASRKKMTNGAALGCTTCVLYIINTLQACEGEN